MHNREHPVRLSVSSPGTPGTALNRKALHRVVRFAQRITGGKLPVARTPTEPDVTGRPKRSSRTKTIQATACSPRYHPEGEVSTGATKLRPRDWTTITNSERRLPKYFNNGTLVTLKNVYTFLHYSFHVCMLYIILFYCILVCAALTLLIQIFVYS
jgi:hypothetical protein